MHHSFIIIERRKLGIDTAIAELDLEVRNVRYCLDMVQEIVNFITASPKRLQCTDVAYMYMHRPFYTAKPVRSWLGTPNHFTVLSQVACVKPRG